MRIWRSRIKEGREEEYDHFARDESKPMFEAQAGNLGVLFTRTGDDCAVISFWKDLRAITAMETSQSYRKTVGKIEGTGFLKGKQTVEIFAATDGFLSETFQF